MAADDPNILAALRRLDRAEADAATPASEEILASIGIAAPPVAPSSSAKTRLLDSLEPGGRFEGFVGRVGEALDFDDLQTRDLFGKIADRAEELVGWVDGHSAGAHYFHFSGGPRVAAADCGLVRVEAGSDFPVHRHIGDEISIILAGQSIEDSGNVFEPGDVVVRTAGSTHGFRAGDHEALVFVVVLRDGIEVV